MAYCWFLKPRARPAQDSSVTWETLIRPDRKNWANVAGWVWAPEAVVSVGHAESPPWVRLYSGAKDNV